MKNLLKWDIVKRSTLLMLLVGLVSAFSVGCGDSQEDYVFTGPANQATTGNLTFQFVEGQAGVVPDGTDGFTFEFYNAAGQFVYEFPAQAGEPETLVPFAPTITVPNVPVTAASVVITAHIDGFPVLELTDEVLVLPGQTNLVDLSDAEVRIIELVEIIATPSRTQLSLAPGGTATATTSLVGEFSNGEVVAIPNAAASFVSSTPSVATVNPDTGAVTGVANGTSIITSTFVYQGETYTSTYQVSVVGQDLPTDGFSFRNGEAVTLPDGGFVYQLLVQETVDGETSLSPAADYQSSFTFESDAPEVASVTNFVFPPTEPPAQITTGIPGTATISLLIEDEVVATFEVTVTDADIASIVVTPSDVTAPITDISLENIGNLDLNTIPTYEILATYVGGATADLSQAGEDSIVFTKALGTGTSVADFLRGFIGGETAGTAALYEAEVAAEFADEDGAFDDITVTVEGLQ